MKYFHLTTPQKNIWNLQKYYADTAISNLCGAIFYNEKRSSVLLRRAICEFVKNQSGLRLQFSEDGEPRQYVSEAIGDIPVMSFASSEEFDSYAEQFAKEPVGLMNCIMYRFVVFNIEDKSGVLVVLSHLVSDAWTFGLMANQVDVIYHKLADETEYDFVKGDYRDYVQSEAQYMASARYERDKIYWEEKYSKRPEVSPIKLCPIIPTSITAGRIKRVVSPSLERKIEAYCEKNMVTKAVIFEAALVTYLSKINPDNHSITIGVPVLNRGNIKEKGIAGMFVSTMPLTIALQDGMTVTELTKQITKGHMDIFRHQKYPYAAILKSLREKQNFQGNLYDVMISYQNAQTNTIADTKWYSNGYSEVPLVIHIDNRDGHESHTINVDYQTEVFRQEAEAEYIIERLQYILEQVVEDGSRCIKDICVVPQKEWNKLVYEFNDTYVEYPREKCVHELFAEQAAETPDRIALVFEDRKFTYRELDEMSNSLAHFLRGKGVKPNDVVPIIAKRSWHYVVATLAVLKCGGAFMPIDPDYPFDRVMYMLGESNSYIVLAHLCQKKYTNYEIIDLGYFDYGIQIEPIENVSLPKDNCYVIFTSGTTGEPKGTVITHGNLVNFISPNNRNNYQLEVIKNCKVFLADIKYCFDPHVFHIYFSLINGLSIIMTPDICNGNDIGKLIDKYDCDTMNCTPTTLRMYMQCELFRCSLAKIKVISVGAEVFQKQLHTELEKYSKAKVYNVYGPTETTIISSVAEVSATNITIGSPIANTQIYILDKDNNPLPIGVAGELCIAGDGVGKGYLNRPELTAEKFVPNPFAGEENHHGKVMYRTGDLARWRADGEIEYLGRIDTQVKIRGLRIELGEIESVMAGFDGIGLTAAADKRDENNRQYLVGYYTTAECSSGAYTVIDEKELRKHLSVKLPKYMVPNYFMHLDKMPMTPSGKTDRKNLPVPDFALQENIYIPPETATEKKLAEIWQELLHVEKVGKTDDFFELGGDSLLAISMLNEIENAFCVEISINDIMEKTSVEQLALCIDNADKVNRIPVCHEKRYVLLPQQKAIYAVCSKNPDTLAYNMPAKIILPESIDRDRLKDSICQVINFHKLLKSHIEAEGDEIYGIYDEDVIIKPEEYVNGKEEAFIRPFDLGQAPLVRIGFTEDSLLVDMHHIVADGESLNIILRNILKVYGGESLQNSSVEYSDYAKYFYGLDTKEHKDYFKEMLKCDFEPIELPRTKNPKQGGKSKLYNIPEEIFAGAKEFAKKNELTDTMVFLAAYGIMLSKYTAKNSILSSIVMRNRIHSDTQNTVGMFVNTLPIHLSVEGRIKEYLQNIKKLVMNLFRYQELPFWDIANTVGMSDKSVVNTSFVYQGDGEKALTLNGEKLVPQLTDTQTAKFDLSMELTPLEHGCRIRMEYNCEEHDEVLMDKLVDAYISILKQLNKEKIADISVLSQEEYQKIIYEFNDTYVEYPREKCVHELFTEQAAKTPDRIALVFEDRKFTYRELDEMSNSLAHFLREKGVKPNDVVPIIAKRSWHVIVAMLGVLKAGGAYMPVDPGYPNNRIKYMLGETEAKIMLTYGWKSTASDCSVIELDYMDYYCNTEEIANINKPVDLSYVLFTSGSTGKPKATLITHANLGNFVNNNNKNNKYQCTMVDTCKNVLADTIFTFDISVFEIYLTLLNGLTVILTKEMADTKYIAGLIEKYEVDVIHTTPTKILMLLQNNDFQKAVAGVKMLMIGAETFSEELYQAITKYTDAVVYNGYGPTETTIGCSFKRINHREKLVHEMFFEQATDITIGSPIANTQIYILDKDSNPLPIGVAGELCIAGDGVGKGYLNRPELTAEKFVPNPFAGEENHHGKVMYCTGDLARWRADGEIEYLGRIDTQVKIRGLRIELGEIESVMASFDGIGLTAAADKRDENNRQYLVGYYTTAECSSGAYTVIDEKELRKHLSAKLPKYMVPNYFMHLDKMPMTPSGKTDRKNLPVPDFANNIIEYVAPETEQEAQLCHLLEEILHMERVGAEDDFFEYGGDSLGAIEYVAKAHDLGIEIALQNVFDYPTVRQLCDFLNRGAVEKVYYEDSDFDKYQEIFEDNVIDKAYIPQKKSLGNVLLTGATGFLGAHVLHTLMKQEDGKIYCLIRSNKDNDRRGRLREILEYYFGEKYEQEFNKRIVPIVGDIEREGLSDHMPDDVQTVIHTAASVKHYGSYDYFHKVNVEGTQHVIDYAKAAGAKLIHVSTLSVSGNSMADDFSVYRSVEEKLFCENSFYIGQPLDNVYIHSKFEAEKRVYDAILSGLDAKVIRVGNLTNRTGDYKFQPNYRENAFLTRVKAILEFGLFPDYLMSLYSEFSPVDLTAEGIVRIAQYADRQTVFHLNSNRPIYFDRFLEVVHELGISMRVVDGNTFNQELQKTIRNTGTEYIFEAFQNDMDEKGHLVYDSNIRIENDFTLWFLKKVGFEWNETDFEYIKGYIDYFRDIGYFKI